ncbi:MAG: SLBB domain-containing protein [Verrucomicrobiae bacterium]|nr:SLBB domain-containing protein [Verrucomicrobiae bacterium]
MSVSYGSSSFAAEDEPFAWAQPASPVKRTTRKAESEPRTEPAPAWAGQPMANVPVDVIRAEVRAEVDQIPRTTPVGSPSWHRRYTLGPGDALNFSMYDRPDLARQAVPIAPDGTISYLQAVGVKAVGRSIPELRKAIEIALSEYHKDPKVIVTPATIGSKRFTIIGKVREPGSYLLDRPLTILEGIASAKGIEVGTVGGSSLELADLERSFVVRNGRKLDVDLASLYYQGQLAQNAFLEPNDYIYVASSLKNEVYVLGSVNRPGRLKMATPLTVTRAITFAGGYNKEAYKQRVLLIRGSIHKPDVTVVDISEILHGKKPDVPLTNRDIIFVDKRPFEMVEKALDSAIFTFVQTVTAESVNDEFTDLSIPAQ